MTTSIVIFGILGFCLFFIGLWCLIAFVLSRVSGWAALAKIYGTPRLGEGRAYLGQTLYLGYSEIFGGSYKNCITVHLSDEAIHLKVAPIFKLGHTKLSIPLTDIEAERAEFLSFKTVKIRFKKAEKIKMRVRRILGEEIMRQINLANPVQTSS